MTADDRCLMTSAVWSRRERGFSRPLPSCRAISKPIPEPPPVMNATCTHRRYIVVFRQHRLGNDSTEDLPCLLVCFRGRVTVAPLSCSSCYTVTELRTAKIVLCTSARKVLWQSAIAMSLWNQTLSCHNATAPAIAF